VIAVGDEAQRERKTGEQQRPGVQVGDRASVGETDPCHPVMKVLAVGAVDRLAVLQPLEHDEGRVQEGNRQQDQGQHEGHDGRRLDRRLDGDHAHQQAQQVRPAIAHEARRGREVVDQEAERRPGRQRRQHARRRAVQIKGDHRQRERDDHTYARRQAVDAVGEVDDVHHRHEADHRQHRPRVGNAGVGEVQFADERQRDRLHSHAEVHGDHRRSDLSSQLDDRR